MTEFIDGHRWPSDAPSSEVSPASTPALISTSEGGSPTDDLPPFEVQAIYQHGMVGLLFDPDHVPLLCAHPLFATAADQLHAAAVDIEQEIENQILTARDRQITGHLR